MVVCSSHTFPSSGAAEDGLVLLPLVTRGYYDLRGTIV